MKEDMIFRYKLGLPAEAQRTDETNGEYLQRLQSLYGCESCKEFGNNGCGDGWIGFYEWTGGYEDENGIESWCKEKCPDWKCWRLEHEIEFQSLKKQQEDSTLVFTTAISEALKLCPDEWRETPCYGDIVRSASAVAVAAMDKSKIGG